MPKQIRKTVFILALGFVIFLPIFSASAADVAPALNPLCWKKAECDKARASFLIGMSDADKKNAAEGFVKGDVPCVGGDGEDAWGKCLPAGVTYTQISIGGQGKYANLGVYLQTVYNYALGIASVLAVIMIIVAGVQWTTSGGNSETITSAKKRITGSVVGLFIAYMSFFILNTINPALTALRLPQVWLIKSQVLGAEFCNGMPSSTQFAFAAGIGASVDKSKYAKASPWSSLSQIKQADQTCGNQYFIQNGGGASCLTTFCSQESSYTKVCAIDPANSKAYKCQEGNIVATVSGGYALAEPGCVSGALGYTGFSWSVGGGTNGWISSGAVPDAGTYVVCNNNNVISPLSDATWVFQPNDETKKIQTFVVKIPKSTLTNINSTVCKTNGGIKGIVLAPAFNKSCKLILGWEVHYIGKGGVDIGPFTGGKFASFDSGNLFSVDELTQGVSVSIVAANVKRSD